MRLLEQSDKLLRVTYLVSEFVRNAFHIRPKVANHRKHTIKLVQNYKGQRHSRHTIMGL